ncbi:protein kinase C delta type [Xenopus tropicalis]|uniref:Protein kinase C delta type n=1 Tax=Xenopus tropicalis TaxID=8364 RepID=A0A8J0R4K8_XENTR|nr:protein kinase C delta type [Xenopus tropicalis]
MSLSKKRSRSPSGEKLDVAKSFAEDKPNKDWSKERSQEIEKREAENDNKSCGNEQKIQNRSIKRRRSGEKHKEKKTSEDVRNKRGRLEGQLETEKESQTEKTTKDGSINRRRSEEQQKEKQIQAEKNTSEDGSIKRRRSEEEQKVREIQAEKKTSEDGSITRKSEEEQKEKQSQESSKERNTEQKEEKNKRPRSPEDPLEGGSIQKRSRLDIKRPDPLDINNYKFHSELGQGGFGQVMLATFRPNKQLVAIKVLKKKSAKTNTYTITKEAYFLKISRGCAFLSHSYAVLQTELEAFFVLEYCSGKSMWDMIDCKGKLPMSSIMDLKPDNILIDKDGHIKICDFGIAEVGLIGKKKTSGLAGTPGYRAPEILSSEDYNAAADWWSFGATMYEMATGELPFPHSGSLFRQRFMIKMRTPNYPDYMSEEMLDLLPKLLENDETQRLGLNGNIREHAFYSTINWEDLENRRLTPPFQPGMPSADDLHEYQPAFSPQCSNEETKWKNFSYVDPSWNWQE